MVAGPRLASPDQRNVTLDLKTEVKKGFENSYVTKAPLGGWKDNSTDLFWPVKVVICGEDADIASEIPETGTRRTKMTFR